VTTRSARVRTFAGFKSVEEERSGGGVRELAHQDRIDLHSDCLHPL